MEIPSYDDFGEVAAECLATGEVSANSVKLTTKTSSGVVRARHARAPHHQHQPPAAPGCEQQQRIAPATLQFRIPQHHTPPRKSQLRNV